MMVRQDERSSDGKIVIPTAWTGQSGLLEKICLFVLLLFLRITEIGELLTGEVFGPRYRRMRWVRLHVIYRRCRPGNGSLETLRHDIRGDGLTEYRFASFSLQDTPLSGSALSVMQFPVPKSVAEKQVGNPPASVVTFYSIPSLRKMSSSSAWLEFVVVPTLERSPADRDPAEPAVSANEDEAN